MLPMAGTRGEAAQVRITGDDQDRLAMASRYGHAENPVVVRALSGNRKIPRSGAQKAPPFRVTRREMRIPPSGMARLPVFTSLAGKKRNMRANREEKCGTPLGSSRGVNCRRLLAVQGKAAARLN